MEYFKVNLYPEDEPCIIFKEEVVAFHTWTTMGEDRSKILLKGGHTITVRETIIEIHELIYPPITTQYDLM